MQNGSATATHYARGVLFFLSFFPFFCATKDVFRILISKLLSFAGERKKGEGRVAKNYGRAAMGIRAVCYPVHRFECAALEYTLSNHPPPFTTSLVPATRRDPNETSSSLLDQSMRVSACQTSFFIHPSQSTPLCIHFSPITRNSLRSRRETRRSLSLCQPR